MVVGGADSEWLWPSTFATLFSVVAVAHSHQWTQIDNNLQATRKV